MVLGSNSCKVNFCIRFLSHNLAIKSHSRSFHQLFFISQFLEVKFSEAVISKCHFPGTAGFQYYFSISLVTEVAPRAPLRLFLQLIKIYTYKLSLLFASIPEHTFLVGQVRFLFPWTTPSVVLPPECPLLFDSLCSESLTIQKFVRDFNWRWIFNFVLPRAGYLEADFPSFPCKRIVLWCHPWRSLCWHLTDQLL